jgi:cell division protein FtsB
MKLEIAFDGEIYLKQAKLKFKLTQQDTVKYNRRRIWIFLPFFLIGIVVLFINVYVGMALIGVGLHIGFNFYHTYEDLRQTKADYYSTVQAQIEEYTKNNYKAVWEFTEEHFGFTTPQYQTRINWEVFTSYSLVQNNLFLHLQPGYQHSYTLGKDEIDATDFEKVVNLVQSKLTQTH